MINIVLLTLSLLTFGGYVDYIWGKYGVQKSISMSIYCLPKNRRWIFTLVLFAFAVPIIIVTQDKILMPIAAWLVAGVGAACNILGSKITKTVHMVGAVGGIVLAYFSLFYEYNYWITIVISAILIIFALIILKKNKIWWVEVIAFLTLLSSLIINYGF